MLASHGVGGWLAELTRVLLSTTAATVTIGLAVLLVPRWRRRWRNVVVRCTVWSIGIALALTPGVVHTEHGDGDCDACDAGVWVGFGASYGLAVAASRAVDRRHRRPSPST